MTYQKLSINDASHEVVEAKPIMVDMTLVERLGASAKAHVASSTMNDPLKIPDGQRNTTLTSWAGSLRKRGMNYSQMLKMLHMINKDICDPPMTDEEVERIAKSVERYPSGNTQGKKKSLTPILTCMDDVQAESISWLWENRIPLGKITLIDGDPGVGKTFFTLDLAARVSSGKPMPGEDESGQNSPHKVLLLSPEDGIADTIKSRLNGTGANHKNILALEGVIDDSGKEQFFSLKKNADLLDSILQEGGYKLVIIDPLNNFLDSVDSYKDTDVRSVLAPLMKIAEKHKVAVVCLRHLNKDTDQKGLYRGLGSVGFAAISRFVYLLGKLHSSPSTRALLCLKTNVAEEPTPIAFNVNNGCVEWIGEIDVTEKDLLSPTKEQNDRRQLRRKAMQFLNKALASGAKPQRFLEEEAAKDGISISTLRRAKEDMKNIEVKKIGFNHWEWRLIQKTSGDSGQSSISNVLKPHKGGQGFSSPEMNIFEDDQHHGDDEVEYDPYKVAEVSLNDQEEESNDDMPIIGKDKQVDY